MFEKSTVHTATAIVLGLLAFHFIKGFLHLGGSTKQTDGTEYIPGQARM